MDFPTPRDVEQGLVTEIHHFFECYVQIRNYKFTKNRKHLQYVLHWECTFIVCDWPPFSPLYSPCSIDTLFTVLVNQFIFNSPYSPVHATKVSIRGTPPAADILHILRRIRFSLWWECSAGLYLPKYFFIHNKYTDLTICTVEYWNF